MVTERCECTYVTIIIIIIILSNDTDQSQDIDHVNDFSIWINNDYTGLDSIYFTRGSTSCATFQTGQQGATMMETPCYTRRHGDAKS